MALPNASTVVESPSVTKSREKSQPTLLDTFDPRKTKELHSLRPHPTTGRLIDSHPGVRTKEMRVLCLGQSRTGTMALFHALQKLGYNPYHMALALGSPKTSLSLWAEALKAKYLGQGPIWGRKEFDKILGDYDAVTDTPCTCFVEELVATYPDAKVVLQERDVEGWMRSMNNTAGRVLSWNWSLVAPWDSSLAGPFWKYAQVVMPLSLGTLNDFSSSNSPARKAFREHYALVRKVVPKARLLEYNVQQGWEPLCSFLDLPVPAEEFPRVNDAEQFVYAHGLMWWLAFGRMVGTIALMIVAPAVGLLAAMWWQKKN